MFIMSSNLKRGHFRKGFTLIELLVVIAIIAILSVVVVLYLNPAELLKQARDSNRLADLDSLNKAITLYLNEAATPSIGTTGVCYQASSVGTTTANCQLYFQTATSTATSTSLALDATGWVPINFNEITVGAPISQLPRDPLGTGDSTFFYSYIMDSTKLTFKLAANIESQLYGNGGSRDVVSTDGGISISTYEAGTALDL